MICILPAFGQQARVTGKITDASSGEALAGVTVQVKGTQTGGISTAEGTYNVTVPAGSTTLVFSFVGFTTQEIEISGRAVIDVVMSEEITALEEIVVTGYSVERKKDIIGSVSVVNTEEMLSTPSGNITTQLAGRVAGVNVTSSGSIDGSQKVRIRGFGSFSGSDPLYIIDGVPGDVNRLNPNDIQSIQILKDAASASVYGARAASGVVIITTKQGQEGAVKVDVNYYYGVNYVSKNDFPDLLNPQEMGELYWKLMEGAGRKYGDANWTHPQYGNGTEPVIPEYVMVNLNGSRTGGFALAQMKVNDPAMYEYYIDPANYDLKTHQIVKAGNTNWFDEVFNPAPVQNIQVTASGGSGSATYVVGLNYFNQESTSDPYSFYKRYTARVNTAFNIQKIFRLGENLQVSYNNGRNVGSPSSAWDYPSLLPPYDIAGGPTGAAVPMMHSTGGSTPIAGPWRNRFDGYDNYGIFGNAFLELTPFKDLVLRSSFGIDYNTNSNKDMTQVTYENAENQTPPNTLTWNWTNRASWTFTNNMTYSKAFGAHSLKILVGTEAIKDFSRNISATKADFLIDNDDDFLIIDAGTGAMTAAGSKSRSMLFSLFGRLDYSYADKYILNATIRRDGSSKFGVNNRYGYFPAVAIGWRISGENFMNNITWLSDLKLRASYGIIGNQTGLSAENQYTTYSQTLYWSYPVSGANNKIAQSFITSRLGNPDARWEKAITTNIGFDASFLSGRLTASFDYFIKETKDLLVTNQAPETGPNVTQPMVNVGDIKNTGIDITVGNRGKIAGTIDYDITANFSTYKNEVLKVLDNPEAVLYGGGTRMGNVTLTKTGQPISMFYGYQTEGFFNTQAEVDAYAAAGYNNTWLPASVGRWKIKDVNGDKIINDLDRTYIGTPHPDFQASLNLSLAYAGFDFSAFVFWNQGGDIFNIKRYNIDFNTFQHNRSARFLYDSWTTDNTDALLPKYDLNDTYSNKYATDYFVEDATYIRLGQLQLGYNLPSSFINFVKLEQLRIYIQAQNLVTWKKEFSGLDPGVSIAGGDLSMGVSGGENPTPKQILFGFNLGF